MAPSVLSGCHFSCNDLQAVGMSVFFPLKRCFRSSCKAVSCLNRFFCDGLWSSRKSPRSYKEVFLDSYTALPTLVKQNDAQNNEFLQPLTNSIAIYHTHTCMPVRHDFHFVHIDLASTTSGPAISMNLLSYNARLDHTQHLILLCHKHLRQPK